MTAVIIVGGRCLTSSELKPLTISFEGDTITALSPAEPVASAPRVKPDDSAVIDASGLVVSPGLIDLQINGGYGHDLQDDPGVVWDLGRELPRSGVTSFLPTIISGPSSRTSAMLEALRARPTGYCGAEPLGAHFEGPMINPRHSGAHRHEYLTGATDDVIDGWHRTAGVAMVTIAPELEGAHSIINELIRRGIVVTAGHSAATADETRAAISAGVSTVTHLFNAMAPLGHRSPNLAGVALADARLTVTMIVDGVHIDPVVVAAVWKAKGPGGVALVTDAVAAMGQPPGPYRLSGTPTIFDGVSTRTADGRLAGSAVTMNRAAANLAEFTGCDRHEALAAATSVPAGIIGETRRGRLDPGSVADLVLLDDAYRVQATVCRGRVAFVDDAARHRLPESLVKAS